ncbi:flagellar hook capping FlgD N-terminal domain-containing protein [Aestuariibius sp. HNIBRBA575]|uniref:flagellar hook capping FlgD N-terminal domain-containing protein n=1 Tax=Aestuariibius sp. HNIBRBA575 TaxID=3233343 RepID=UPI0034A5007F
MEVNSAGASTTTHSATTNATSSVSSDFETFLKMLTVQMQNQDPLNPVDSSDYAVQLATFSGVEQQVLTNDLLSALSGQLAASGMSDMASWVGKEARAIAPAEWDGTNSVTVSPNPLTVADRTELVIRDRWGSEVDRREIPATTDPYEWDGLDSNGTPLPTGLYSFELANFSGDDLVTQDPVEVYTEVMEVQSNGHQTVLLLSSGVHVAASGVTALRNGS